MLIELRSYDLTPGKALAYLEYFRTYGLGLVTQSLPMLGYWLAETGRLNRIEHMWAYESFAERDACRAKLMQNRDWMENFIPEAFADVITQENRFFRLAETSANFDSALANRTRTHANQDKSAPMFAPNLHALSVDAEKTRREGMIASFITVSGRDPGAIYTLTGGTFESLARNADTLSHQILRPLSCSPLR